MIRVRRHIPMKRPAFQFYPADWRKDASLQSCSLGAQGLWINMICIAHECEPYGHLTINGKPMSAAQIARLVGLSTRDCDRLMAELIEAGVVAITDERSDHGEGVFYSRRMVRDEDLRARRAEGGKAGSEHGAKGAEHGVKGGRPPKERGVIKPPLEPPPSSSSSTSVDSVANATDGKPSAEKRKAKSPADMTKEELWAAGKSILQAGGVPAAQCGSFVGKLVKDYGDATVIEAVRAAVVTNPADPREYLKAACQRLKGERKDPVTVPSDAAERSQAYLRQQAEHARAAVPPPANIRQLVRKMTGVA